MTMNISTLAVLAALVLLLTGLGFTVWIDPYVRKSDRRTMLVIIGLCCSLIVQNLWEYQLAVGRWNMPLRAALSIYGYSVRPVILILFLYIIRQDGKKWPLWTLAGINTALYISSPWTKLCFYIREWDNLFMRGPLWLTCFVISAILLAELLARTVSRWRKAKKLDHLIPLFVAAIIIVSVFADYAQKGNDQPIALLTIAITVGSVFYYIWLHLQFVREHERDLMAAQRIQIMMTQIQPHFLFNALNTIRALYAKDPPLADKTLEDFSTYLRQNLEPLNQPDLIPFSRELDHTRLYAKIEMLRFPNVSVEYLIEDTQFEIPALTIQPLVENAIRHGVRGREDGLVTVSATKDGDSHRITITDNGVGFDPKAKELSEGTHIGLRNVQDRIEQMCGGTMVIQSEINKGTAVTLLIPDQGRSGQKERGI